jgi:hypothetical protein
VREAESGA